MGEDARHSARLIVAVLFVALAGVTFAGLDDSFGNGDEVIYAQGVREMKQAGSYRFLLWQDTTTLQRPAAPFALAALTSGALGDSERALRLPSALFSLATLLVLFLILRRLGVSVGSAAVGVILCAGAPTYHLFSRSLMSDSMLTLGIAIAFFGTLVADKRRLGFILAGSGIGLAALAKSVAAFIPAVALLPWLWMAARRRRDYAGLAVAAVLGVLGLMPFFALGLAEFGGAFLDLHLGQNVVGRGQGELPFGLPGGILAYATYLIDTSWWSLPLLVGIPAVGLVTALRQKNHQLTLLAAGTLLPLLLLSLYGTRLPHYLTPYFVPAAACAGMLAHDASTRLRAHTKLAAPLLPVVAVTLGLLGLISPPTKHLLPSPAAVRLGGAAKGQPDPGPIYTLDWYAPAVAYYGDRRWKMLSRSRFAYDVIRGIDFMRNADVARMVPPFPEGSALVAGPTEALLGLAGVEFLAEAGSFSLARVRFRDSREQERQ